MVNIEYVLFQSHACWKLTSMVPEFSVSPHNLKSHFCMALLMYITGHRSGVVILFS